MSGFIQPAFGKRLAIRVLVCGIMFLVGVLMVLKAWTALLVVACVLSALGAWVAAAWDDIEEHLAGMPALSAGVLVSSAILGAPAAYLCERVPFLPKSRWMRYRSAARRVQRTAREAKDIHLATAVFDGREIAPALYLIFARAEQARAYRPQRDAYIDAYRAALTQASVLERDLVRLYVGFVSKEEIAASGGGFAFWRDGPEES